MWKKSLKCEFFLWIGARFKIGATRLRSNETFFTLFYYGLLKAKLQDELVMSDVNLRWNSTLWLLLTQKEKVFDLSFIFLKLHLVCSIAIMVNVGHFEDFRRGVSKTGSSQDKKRICVLKNPRTKTNFNFRRKCDFWI